MPDSSGDVSSADIMSALRDRYGFEFCGLYPEVDTGTDDLNRRYRIDAVLAHRVDGRITFEGFEVKISRGDFLRDNKWQLYANYVDALSLVCPYGMVSPEEVPRGFGLMYYNPKTRKLRFKRKPQTNPDADTRPVEDLIFARLAYRDIDGKRHRDRFADAETYVREGKLYKDLGKTFGTALARDAQCYRDMLDDPGATAYGRFYQAVSGMMAKQGVFLPPIRGGNPEKVVSAAVETMEKAIGSMTASLGYRSMLRELRDRADFELRRLDMMDGGQEQ